MFDGFSYLLGKRSGDGSGGWTTKNADKTNLVFKNSPEEVMLDVRYMDEGAGCLYRIMNCRMIKIPHDGFSSFYQYWCQASMGFSHDGTSGFVAVGRLHIDIDVESNAIDEVCFSGDFRNDDGFLEYIEQYFNSGDISICAYKGTPVEISLITFTINDTEYNATEGMTWEEWCPSEYSNSMFACDGDSQMVYDESGYFVLNSDGSQARSYENIVEGTVYQVNYD